MSYIIGIDTGISTGITVIDKQSKNVVYTITTVYDYEDVGTSLFNLANILKLVSKDFVTYNSVIVTEYALTNTQSELSKAIAKINACIVEFLTSNTSKPLLVTVQAGTWKQITPIKNIALPNLLQEATTHQKDAYRICMWYLRTLDNG